MKKVLYHIAGILTAVFIIFIAGLFVGRQQTQPIPTPAITPTGTVANESSNNKININTASVDELCKLPGIGYITANAIVEYRTENGPFERCEDIINVTGIGNKKAKGLMPLICVD